MDTATLSMPLHLQLSQEHVDSLCNDYSTFAVLSSPSDDGWTAERSPCDGVTMTSRDAPGTSLRIYRAVGTVPAPPAAVAHALFNSATRMLWDGSYEGIDDVVMYDFSSRSATLPAGTKAITLSLLKIKV